MNPFSRIIEYCERLLKVLQNLADAIHGAAERGPHKTNTTNPLPERIEVRFPPADNTQRETEQRKQLNTQRWIAGGTWCAFIAAAIYGAIALCQWKEMKTQTKQNLESFRVDERAWIELQPIRAIPKAPASGGFGTIFTYNIFPKNAGKTAAYDIVAKAIRGGLMSGLSLGDNVAEIASYQKMLQGNTMKVPDILISRRVPKALGPSDVSSAPFDLYGQEPKQWGSDPQKWTYNFLIGRIDYADAFGVAHWMTFCLFIADSSGNPQYCQYGNDEDRNPELPP